MSLERDDSNGQLKKIINVMATRGRWLKWLLHHLQILKNLFWKVLM
jgi:hypothetical protein